MDVQPKHSTFRLSSRGLFLTYPHCQLERDACRDLLLAKFPNTLLKYVVARERHQDGNLHLHVYLSHYPGSKFNIRDAQFLDIENHHGNYQTVRHHGSVIKYLLKDDRDYLTNFTQEELDKVENSKKSSSTRSDMGKRILAGENIKDLVEEYPQLIFGFNRLQGDIKTFTELSRSPKSVPAFLPNTWGIVLPTGATGKRRHFWIWSSVPNRGKTTFALSMEQYGYHLKSSDISYWNLDGSERGIILDEYNSPVFKFNQLNQLCDGSYEFRRIHQGLIKLNKPLIIVLSNVSLEEMYPIKKDLLLARFKVICVDSMTL